jgi:YVTN family beta-propeller protein
MSSTDMQLISEHSQERVVAGFGVVRIALDPTTHKLYTANLFDASVSVIDTGTCNRLASSGCGVVPSERAAGD